MNQLFYQNTKKDIIKYKRIFWSTYNEEIKQGLGNFVGA